MLLRNHKKDDNKLKNVKSEHAEKNSKNISYMYG